MKKLKTWHAFVGTMAISFSPLSIASDIYRSPNADGSFRYASTPLDPSYTLYIEGESKAKRNVVPSSSAPRISKSNALDPFIERYAQKYQVDVDLVRAVIAVESAFNPKALSPKGAAGAMQLMPATAARYGVTQRTDPAQNIEAGVRYLRDLLARHEGNVALALAAYNAGEGAIARYGKRIPPYPETMQYVPAVLMRLQASRNLSSR
jgi:soluble lytic murein transglycosylase-like protein